MTPLLSRRASLAAAVVSGVLYWLAFAGMDVSVLTFVCFVPLWIALQGQTPKRALWLGLITGTTMNVCGFYWLLNMLKTFSGFPTPLCMLFVLIVCAYQGMRLGFMGWLYGRAVSRGWPAPWVFLGAFTASELLFPVLFPWYYAATVHNVASLAQAAELGGPILVGLVLVGANLAIAEPLLARMQERKIDRKLMVAGAVGLLLNLVFGVVRIHSVEAKIRESEPLHVGVVQGNMGLFQKREDPGEGLRRHKKLSAELRQKGVELVVWSESSVTMPIPERMRDSFYKNNVTGDLGMAAIFGGVLYRVDPDRERWFNSAFSSDLRGNVTARYDKEFLLAFGEYLPLGDTFPILYEWSPHSGKFSAGTELTPLHVPDATGKDRTVTVLICYEDILPGFTNDAVRHADPELLVNITNDAWFGDTSEPWEHLALAKFRAIEHRRYLVRSTNSGVSAIVDPLGRIVKNSGTFRAETIDAVVHWMRGKTVYEAVGDKLWYLASFAVIAAAFVRRKRGTTEPSAAKT